MELLLILTYAAICIAAFKIFKIPLNKWTVPTAALGGAVLLGLLFMVMNYNHPYSETVRQYYATTALMPEVRGRVVDVPAKPNQPVKKGDVLFRINPEPFEDEIEGLEGQLLAARKDLERAEVLVGRGTAAQRTLDQARATVTDLQAELDEARFNLEHSTMVAPTDGFVAQLALRPGMMVVPLPFSPGMVFVHTEERLYYGWFRQNYLLRLVAGSRAEVAFDGIPGMVFQGEVVQVVPAIPEGQVRVRADLLGFDREKYPGRVLVAIDITDPRLDEYELPSGMFGQAAVYSEHFEGVGTLRKILLRMTAWMNYVFPIH